MTSNFQTNEHRLQQGFVFLLWAITNVFLFFKIGVLTTGEAQKYLVAANQIDQLEFLPKYLFYSTYIILVAFIKSPFLIVLIQLVASAFALRFLMTLVHSMGGNWLITGLLYATCFPIQYWNMAIYTDSLFISGLIFLYYFTFNWKPNWIVGIGVFLLFLRPVSVIFLSAFLFFWTDLRKIHKLYLIALVPTALVALAFRYFYFPDFFSFFVTNQVICEVCVDENLLVLTGKKLLYFLTLYRPHYTLIHNLVNGFYFIILLIALVALKKPLLSYQRFTLLLLITYVIFVLFTCVNWNNRFIAPLLPFVFVLLGGHGAILETKKGKINLSLP